MWLAGTQSTYINRLIVTLTTNSWVKSIIYDNIYVYEYVIGEKIYIILLISMIYDYKKIEYVLNYETNIVLTKLLRLLLFWFNKKLKM